MALLHTTCIILGLIIDHLIHQIFFILTKANNAALREQPEKICAVVPNYILFF